MTDGFVIHEVDSLVVCRLESAPTASALAAIHAAAAARRDRPVVVVLVPPGGRPPLSRLHKHALQTLHDLDGSIAAWVVVLRTGAMARAAFRAVAGTVLLAARIQTPVVLFDTAERATAWLTLRGLYGGTAEDIDPVGATG